MYSVGWKNIFKKTNKFLNFELCILYTSRVTERRGDVPVNTTVFWNLNKTTRRYVTQHDNN
jgi:hypothetical protein